MTNAVLFWTIAVIVTGFVLLALIPPLIGRGGRASRREDSARALYRDQLARVENDLANQRITQSEAEAARAEIGRRVLRTAEPGQDHPAAAQTTRRRRRGIAWAAGVMVTAPAAAVALYLATGQPHLADQPLSARKDVADAAQLRANAESLVSEMTVAVGRDPGDLRSWVMLARALTTLERIDEAAQAYAQAIALAPDAADLHAAYGEVLVRQADGQVTIPAAEAFRATLERVPDDPRARYYLALRHFQQGDLRAALAAWRSLAADSPSTAGWMDAVRARIAETEGALGEDAMLLADMDTPDMDMEDRGEPLTRSVQAAPAEAAEAEAYEEDDGSGGDQAAAPPPTARQQPPAQASAATPQPAPGPPPLSEAQIATMMQLPPEERAGRVADMVNGLAARLEQDPDDVDGWMILARSYVALDRVEAAVEALANASHYGPDRIDAQIAYARIILEGQPLDAPVPREAIEAFERVIDEDPTHPDALWFLGLAAAQQREFAAARAHWTRLLDTLDPQSEAYIDVQSYIAALSGGEPGGSGGAPTDPPVDSSNSADPAESR